MPKNILEQMLDTLATKATFVAESLPEVQWLSDLETLRTLTAALHRDVSRLYTQCRRAGELSNAIDDIKL